MLCFFRNIGKSGVIILNDILIKSVNIKKGQEKMHIIFEFHQPNCIASEEVSTYRSKELSIVVKAHDAPSYHAIVFHGY